MNITTKLRLVSEKILSRAIPNEVAFEISDIGKNRDIDNYQTPISPFERYWADPSEINKMTGRRWKPWSNRRGLLGKVQDGEWDERPPPAPEGKDYPQYFSNYDKHLAYKSYIEDGINPKETEFYRRGVCEGQSPKYMLNTFKEYERLYENIRESGYLTQDELGNFPRDKTMRYANEVTVDVARTGEFLFVDGRHRLSVAKVLDLPRIPVVPLVRHRLWVEKLEKATIERDFNNLPKNHPDVRLCQQFLD